MSAAPTILLTDGLPGTLRTRESVTPNVGRLFTPRHVNAIPETIAAGVSFAADNDAFNGFDADRWLAMLDKLEPFAEACRFVTVPDAVCDAPGTFALWRAWAPVVRERGFRPALVLQNGMVLAPNGIRSGHDVIAWSEIGAVFVGGDDAYKDGCDAALIVLEARRRGVWVHVGRVNTRRRLEHAAALGADSVDGSGWVKFRNAMMPRLRRFHDAGAPAVAHLAELTFEELEPELGEETDGMTEGTKVCPRCGEEKDRATDYTHRRDGSIFSWCKACNAAYRRERREAARKDGGK